jgi:hypothetical protein
MRIVGSVLGALGGLSLMYFGIHQMMGKLPYPFTTENAAKLASALCIIVMAVGFLLINRSGNKPADSEAGPESSETKPNPDL